MSNLTRLPATAMRTISRQWLEDTDVRAILESDPKTSSLIGDIQSAHDTIVAAMGGEDPASLDAQIEQLRSEGDSVDNQHDRKLRGCWQLLTALAELADTPEMVSQLTTLRDTLMPRGISDVNTTWAAESGAAAGTREKLDAHAESTLRAIHTVENRTLWDEVETWLSAGDALGPIAAKKAALEQRRDGSASSSDTPAISKARMAWIRLARALESNMELATSFSPEQRAKVLGLLLRTAENAERSSSRRKPAKTEPAT